VLAAVKDEPSAALRAVLDDPVSKGETVARVR
jgi:hypothetical protein